MSKKQDILEKLLKAQREGKLNNHMVIAKVEALPEAAFETQEPLEKAGLTKEQIGEHFNAHKSKNPHKFNYGSHTKHYQAFAGHLKSKGHDAEYAGYHPHSEEPEDAEGGAVIRVGKSHFQHLRNSDEWNKVGKPSNTEAAENV